MYLFDLASRHMTWLSVRQSVTAANIANADTAGYRAQDIEPFSSHMANADVQLSTTSPLHVDLTMGALGSASSRPGASWASSHSGNNVSIEQELMKASSTNRMMNVDASLTKAFHRMLLASTKG